MTKQKFIGKNIGWSWALAFPNRLLGRSHLQRHGRDKAPRELVGWLEGKWLRYEYVGMDFLKTPMNHSFSTSTSWNFKISMLETFQLQFMLNLQSVLAMSVNDSAQISFHSIFICRSTKTSFHTPFSFSSFCWGFCAVPLSSIDLRLDLDSIWLKDLRRKINSWGMIHKRLTGCMKAVYWNGCFQK